MPPRRLLVGQEPEIVEAYRRGDTIPQLAERYHCSTESIRTALRLEGVEARRRGPRSPLEGREDEVATAYRAGATVRELAERFGADVRTIRKVLAARDVPMRPPGRRPAP